MNRLALFATLSGLGLMAVTAGILYRIDANRELGQPGLVMAQRDIFDDLGNIVSTNTVALPDAVLDFISSDRPITSGELNALPSDTVYARRVYQGTNGFEVLLNVVMMGVDRTSIHRPQLCLSGQGWKITKTEEVAIPMAATNSILLPALKLTAERTMSHQGTDQVVKAIYVYWFVADGYITAQHGERMWWMTRELLTSGQLQRWAYVSAISFCLPGQEEATFNRMSGFISAAAPTFHRFSDKTVISDTQ